jgi:hypothetical protein
MRIDYPEFEKLNARARRERAQAVYELLIAPLAKLFARSKAPKKPLHSARWLAAHGR